MNKSAEGAGRETVSRDGGARGEKRGPKERRRKVDDGVAGREKVEEGRQAEKRRRRRRRKRTVAQEMKRNQDE